MSSSFRAKKDSDISHPTRYYSSRQEKSIAEATHGRVTKNSGATAFQKGDILLDSEFSNKN